MASSRSKLRVAVRTPDIRSRARQVLRAGFASRNFVDVMSLIEYLGGLNDCRGWFIRRPRPCERIISGVRAKLA
jgi:hypothetical protein